MERTPKKIGLIGAVAIGIGGMVGGGIFAVLGEAVSLAHGATPLAFLLAGTVALLTAAAYARLSVAFPNRGGTVYFIDTAFGNNLASGSVNLMLWLSYLVTIALYAVAFASYARTFFDGQDSSLLKHLLISAAILLPTLINLLSATFVSRSETVIVVLKLLLLAVIILFSAPYVHPAHLGPSQWGPLLPVFAAGMIIFVAYEGFELIANAAEDIAQANALVDAMLGKYAMGQTVVPGALERSECFERLYGETKALLDPADAVLETIAQILLERESISREAVAKIVHDVL
jgi:hypothetical protein